jgi:hypothetical protein
VFCLGEIADSSFEQAAVSADSSFEQAAVYIAWLGKFVLYLSTYTLIVLDGIPLCFY